MQMISLLLGMSKQKKICLTHSINNMTYINCQLGALAGACNLTTKKPNLVTTSQN